MVLHFIHSDCGQMSNIYDDGLCVLYGDVCLRQSNHHKSKGGIATNTKILWGAYICTTRFWWSSHIFSFSFSFLHVKIWTTVVWGKLGFLTLSGGHDDNYIKSKWVTKMAWCAAEHTVQVGGDKRMMKFSSTEFSQGLVELIVHEGSWIYSIQKLYGNVVFKLWRNWML